MPAPAAVHRKAADLGKLAVDMTAQSGSGHPSSALSLAHIVVHLMYSRMRFDPANPWHAGSDRLVLSEGHAVPIVYAAYADLGGAVGLRPQEARTLTVADLAQLRARDSVLDGHPNPGEGFPFFDSATGSLGMGLSVAAGLAIGARLDGTDRRVFAIIGDGESREGQIWEAADFIADHRLHHVCAIINANGHGQAAAVSPQQSPERLAAKLAAFGWATAVIDGHDPAAIEAALADFPRANAPLAIVAKTVKGWGVEQFLKGNWHGKPAGPADVAAAAASLDATVARLGAASASPLPAPPRPTAATPARPDPREVQWPGVGDVLAAGGFAAAAEKRILGTRKAYGAALKIAGDLLPQVVVLDADVSNSTFSEIFGKAHPARFVECKIAEQNMVSAAAGLAAAGFIPFVNSFAKFIARAYDQVEMANISRANIKIVGSHSGISLAADGPSQMSVLDVAYFRALGSVRGDDRRAPLCWSLQPSDAVSAVHLTRLMLATRQMCYMRTHRPEVPFLYEPNAPFELGGLNVLRPGDDLALVSSGYMVHVALAAADLLARQNIRAAVVDCYCLPLNGEKLSETLQRCGGQALVVEDNYGGGLGAAVAEVAARHGKPRVEALYCQRMPKSTRETSEILEYCGVAPGQVADQALALLKRPR